MIEPIGFDNDPVVLLAGQDIEFSEQSDEYRKAVYDFLKARHDWIHYVYNDEVSSSSLNERCKATEALLTAAILGDLTPRCPECRISCVVERQGQYYVCPNRSCDRLGVAHHDGSPYLSWEPWSNRG